MVIGKHYQWHNVERGCKVCSYKAGHATSSMSGQDSRAKHYIIEQCIWAVHPAHSTDQHGSTVQTSRWCHGHQWASKTCSWLKPTPRQHGHCRWWTNILVHPPTTNHGRWVLLLAGEGVRYCMFYCNIFMPSIYVSFVFLYILLKIYSRQQNRLDIWEFWIVHWIYILIKWLKF